MPSSEQEPTARRMDDLRSVVLRDPTSQKAPVIGVPRASP